MEVAAANGMTRITLSFLLSMLSDNNIGPEAPVNSKHHWSYKGPEGPQNWPLHYKQCGGARQSPVDIKTARTVFDANLGSFHLDNFNSYSEKNGPTMLNITNNGHAASVRVTSNMRVSGGGLSGTYKTAEFHFHWGSTDDVGSEHAMDGRKFPLEMHVVNFAEKYGTIQEAMTKPDGLAVLGVFFQLSDRDNDEFASVDNALRYVSKAGEHNLVERLRLRALIPDDISRYWRYSGSLTTPYCFESVTWTVFATPQKISRRQLETLRSLLHEAGHEKGNHQRSNALPSRLVDNWRPLQPLNDRTVYRSFDDGHNQAVQSPSISPERNVQVSLSNHPTASTLVDSKIAPTAAVHHTELASPNVHNDLTKQALKSSPEALSSSQISPSVVKIKIGHIPRLEDNSVGLGNHELNPGVEIQKSEQNKNIGPVDSQADISRLPFTLPLVDNNTTLSEPLNSIHQMQLQRQNMELQNQRQQQTLKKLQEQRQQLLLLHERTSQIQQSAGSPTFSSSSSGVPQIQTGLQSSVVRQSMSPGGRLVQDDIGSSNYARTLRNGKSFLNNGINKGDQNIQATLMRQSNQPNAIFPNQLPIQRQQQQQPQQRISPTASSQPQNQRQYVKPLDPNTRITFLRDGYAQQNQQAFFRPRPQEPTRVPNKQSLAFKYNSQYPYQRQQQQQQQQQPRGDVKNSLFAQLSKRPVLQQNALSSGSQQPIFRTYSAQSARPQQQNIIFRQQQQRKLQQQQRQQQQQQQHQQQQHISRQQPQHMISGPKLTATQLRTLLERLAPPNRVATGTQTLITPAPRMLSSASKVNTISKTSGSVRRGVINSRNNFRDIANTRLPEQNKRAPPMLTSGRNLVPVSANQRLQRISNKMSPTSFPSASQLSSSSSLSPSPSAASSSLAAYQIRNRSPTSYSRTGNNNWFFSDSSAGDTRPAPSEELPYVFLHRIQKPVRIRRPFYERLYSV